MCSSDLPSLHLLTDGVSCVQPEHVQQHRSIKRGRGYTQEVLVSWTGLPASLCTWEPEALLRRRFPDAPAWGQAGPQGLGDVSAPSRSTRAGGCQRPRGSGWGGWTCHRTGGPAQEDETYSRMACRPGMGPVGPCNERKEWSAV